MRHPNGGQVPPDDFEPTVLRLVKSFGPMDALEPPRARVVAVEVLIRSIVEAGNRSATGFLPRKRVECTPFHASMRGLDKLIVLETLINGISSLWEIADMIVRECFADEAFQPRPYLDTPEITWFVAVAHGTALRLMELDEAGAQRLAVEARHRDWLDGPTHD